MGSLTSGLLDGLYLREVNFLSSLQESLSSVGEYIIPVSSIGDPSKGFILYFPIFLALNYVKGIKFLGAFIVSEWINMVSNRKNRKFPFGTKKL